MIPNSNEFAKLDVFAKERILKERSNGKLVITEAVDTEKWYYEPNNLKALREWGTQKTLAYLSKKELNR